MFEMFLTANPPSPPPIVRQKPTTLSQRFPFTWRFVRGEHGFVITSASQAGGDWGTYCAVYGRNQNGGLLSAVIEGPAPIWPQTRHGICNSTLRKIVDLHRGIR